MSRTSRRRSLASPPVTARAVPPAGRFFPASRNSFDRLEYRLSAMPSRRHSSAMLYSPRSPSRTTRIFASAEWCFRVARRMFFTTYSGVTRVSDFCVICASPKSYGEPGSLRSSSHPISLGSAAVGHGLRYAFRLDPAKAYSPEQIARHTFQSNASIMCRYIDEGVPKTCDSGGSGILLFKELTYFLRKPIQLLLRRRCEIEKTLSSILRISLLRNQVYLHKHFKSSVDG